MTEWATTTGKMLAISLGSEQSRSTDHQGFTRYKTVYRPLVEYEFFVDGVRYVGDRASQQKVSTGKASAEKFITEHPAGSEFPIYYNPDDPATSFIEKGLGFASEDMKDAVKLTAGITALTAGLGIGLTILFFIGMLCILAVVVGLLYFTN